MNNNINRTRSNVYTEKGNISQVTFNLITHLLLLM